MKIALFSSKKNIIIVSFISGLFLGAIFFLVRLQFQSPLQSQNAALNDAEVLSLSQEITPIQSDDNLKTLGILLLGYGGKGHQGGFLTDALQVLFFDFEKEKIALVSIPRDLWVKLPNGRESKINSVFSLDVNQKDPQKQAANIKAIVSAITGLKINYFISVDFVGFQRAIGINLKGIDVEVGETLDDPWYPIEGEQLNPCGKTAKEIAELTSKYAGFELERQFPCRYEKLHFEKGIIKMQGGDALKYVRSRHGSAEGDVSRGRRQQEVLKAIAKKLFLLDALNNIPNFYDSFVKHVSTDLDLDSAKFLAPFLQKYRNLQMININLATTNVLAVSKLNSGQSVMIPKEGMNKWNNIHFFIRQQLEEN